MTIGIVIALTAILSVNIPLEVIAPPIGWQSRYTIYAKPEQIEAVLSWFARGIVVRQSHGYVRFDAYSISAYGQF